MIIGSRGSQLALWQARWIQGQLNDRGVEARIEIIRTTGDHITDVPLAQAGGKGLFTKEIEDALLDGRIDVAVHSLKDLPTALPDGLRLSAIPPREDPRDGVVGVPLDALKPGAVVGTSSLRRAAQVLARRPDLKVESIRGNVDTRLRKLDEGLYDAILLAASGMKRLGWAGRFAEILEPEVMCPAPGQGALGIETRAGGGDAERILSTLNDPATEAAVTAERSLLSALGGGCQTPLGAYCRAEGGRLALQAVIVSLDGSTVYRDQATGEVAAAAALGAHLAERLLRAGARQIVDSLA